MSRKATIILTIDLLKDRLRITHDLTDEIIENINKKIGMENSGYLLQTTFIESTYLFFYSDITNIPDAVMSIIRALVEMDIHYMLEDLEIIED